MFVSYHFLQLLEKSLPFSCSLLQRLSQSGGVLNPDSSRFLVPRALGHWTIRFVFLEHLEHWWWREEVCAQVASQSASQSRPSHMNHCSIIITLSQFPSCFFSSSDGFLWSLWVSKVCQCANLMIMSPMWYIKTDSSSFWTVGKFSLKPKSAIYFWYEEIMSESLGITVKPTQNQ